MAENNSKAWFRQGDVALIPVEKLPEGEGKKVDRDNGRLILAYGEVTGHAHAIVDDRASLVEKFGTTYLVAPEKVEVRHDEHATIDLPAGVYEVRHQREYHPEAVRNVMD